MTPWPESRLPMLDMATPDDVLVVDVGSCWPVFVLLSFLALSLVPLAQMKKGKIRQAPGFSPPRGLTFASGGHWK